MPALLFHSTRPEKKVTREKFNFSDDGKLNHRLLHEIVARNNQSSGLRTQTDFWSSFLSTRKQLSLPLFKRLKILPHTPKHAVKYTKTKIIFSIVANMPLTPWAYTTS